MNSYQGIVASTSQLISFKELQLKSYWIYIPKMISIPFLPETVGPAEFITGRQSLTAGAGREGEEPEGTREV